VLGVNEKFGQVQCLREGEHVGDSVQLILFYGTYNVQKIRSHTGYEIMQENNTSSLVEL